MKFLRRRSDVRELERLVALLNRVTDPAARETLSAQIQAAALTLARKRRAEMQGALDEIAAGLERAAATVRTVEQMDGLLERQIGAFFPDGVNAAEMRELPTLRYPGAGWLGSSPESGPSGDAGPQDSVRLLTRHRANG
jgi:hypothetical protein